MNRSTRERMRPCLRGWGSRRRYLWGLLVCQVERQGGGCGHNGIAPSYPACLFGSIPRAWYLAATIQPTPQLGTSMDLRCWSQGVLPRANGVLQCSMAKRNHKEGCFERYHRLLKELSRFALDGREISARSFLHGLHLACHVPICLQKEILFCTSLFY